MPQPRPKPTIKPAAETASSTAVSKPTLEELFASEESPLLGFAYNFVRRREIAERKKARSEVVSLNTKLSETTRRAGTRAEWRHSRAGGRR